MENFSFANLKLSAEENQVEGARRGGPHPRSASQEVQRFLETFFEALLQKIQSFFCGEKIKAEMAQILPQVCCGGAESAKSRLLGHVRKGLREARNRERVMQRAKMLTLESQPRAASLELVGHFLAALASSPLDLLGNLKLVLLWLEFFLKKVFALKEEKKALRQMSNRKVQKKEKGAAKSQFGARR